MITVEHLYREDVSGRIVVVGGGKELRGPCPGCGGDDRFGVFPHQNNGKGSFFCGRFKGNANTGCGKGGDAIQYLREFRGMSYVDACGYLGIEPKNTNRQSHYKYSAPQPLRRKQTARPEFSPEDKGFPSEVVDPAMWREHGMKFVELCHQELLKRNTAIAYLMSRGISREVIEQYKLGYHPGQESRGKQGQPSYRPWPSWGLRDENVAGRVRKIALPAGIVIPYMFDGKLNRITIRLNRPDEKTGKYHYVKGSKRDLWFTNPSAKIFVTAEAELDCLAIISSAGDMVGTVGIGTTGAKPDKRIHQSLLKSQCILGSLDFDKPRQNLKTGRLEMPGGYASVWWKTTYPQHRRWPVPVGKDPGEAFASGINLRDWIIAGLPDHLQPSEEKPPAKEHAIETEQAKVEQEQSCVIECDLSNGDTIYLIKFDQYGRLTDEGRGAWQRLTDERKPVFTEKEMGLLHHATQKMNAEEKLAAGLQVIELKKLFGGVVKNSRVLEDPSEVEEIVKVNQKKG